ncbi:hypothetical protein T09_105 [Trichinella sp. T9]|nr:hypothetical protein T09_105 [Trichinella sp. T9]
MLLQHIASKIYTAVAKQSYKIRSVVAAVAEWLRRLTRNQLGSARTGSNPVCCVRFFTSKLSLHFCLEQQQTEGKDEALIASAMSSVLQTNSKESTSVTSCSNIIH